MNMPRFSAAALAMGGALLLASTATAQGPDRSGTAVFAGTIQPEAPYTGYSPDVPMPPRVLLGVLSQHRDPPIPVGPQRPGPQNPETQIVDPAVVDTGVLTYFQDEDVKPSGASTSVVGEPSVAQTDHVSFQTGNWYAARSVDNGASWTHVNPYTFFPSVDGGFCCDQKIIYIPSHDITVWVLQYVYSSTSQTAGYRIAVANGDADLGSTSASAWTSYYITPQNRFGFGAQAWFDFPDIAYSNAGFYLSCNVYNGADSYLGTTLIRFDLAQLQANGSVGMTYINSISHGLEFSPRMAKGGTGDRIFWCSLISTSSVQVGYFTDANSYSTATRSIGTVSTTISSTPSPDGVNWAARAPTRFRGAYGNASEVGFMFTSGSTGASRPNPYIRVLRFTADTARTLIAEYDIYSTTGAWAYAAACTNSAGDIGMVAAYGSPSVYVSSVAGIIDSYNPWGSLAFSYFGGTGQDSPNQSRWGDYFDVRQHDNYPTTFVGTGMRQIGGSANSNNTPRYLWFGRDDYLPTWVYLTVQSSGAASVPITVAQTDMSGSKDGTTSFSRRFTRYQPYTLTAPNTSGSYLFERWRYNVAPGGAFIDQPVGDRTLDVSGIGVSDDTAEAVYKLARTLNVSSTNPASGVTIAISPADFNGAGNGSTSFSRTYRDGEVVTLTAPTAVGFNPFRYWTVNGLIALGGNTINVTMNGTKNCVANYWTNVAGATAFLGAGCRGSNGLVPGHTASWPAGQQGPQQGTVTRYLLSNARAFTACAINFGLSNTSWGAFPLPLDLGLVGAPGCRIYHDLGASQSLTTDGAGASVFNMTWPVDPAAVGARVYSSYIIIDPGVPRPTIITVSDALTTRIGGNI